MVNPVINALPLARYYVLRNDLQLVQRCSVGYRPACHSVMNEQPRNHSFYQWNTSPNLLATPTFILMQHYAPLSRAPSPSCHTEQRFVMYCHWHLALRRTCSWELHKCMCSGTFFSLKILSSDEVWPRSLLTLLVILGIILMFSELRAWHYNKTTMYIHYYDFNIIIFLEAVFFQ